MKKFAPLFALVLVVAASGVFASGNGEKAIAVKASMSSTSDSADKAAIAALWQAYSKSAIDGDLSAYMQLHDPDAYKMPEGKAMFRLWDEKAALTKKWARAAAEYTTQMTITPKEIVVMGDYAYTMGTYYKALTPKAGGAALVTDGKFLTILRKNADGQWKILRDCYNNNGAK